MTLSIGEKVFVLGLTELRPLTGIGTGVGRVPERSVGVVVTGVRGTSVTFVIKVTSLFLERRVRGKGTPVRVPLSVVTEPVVTLRLEEPPVSSPCSLISILRMDWDIQGGSVTRLDRLDRLSLGSSVQLDRVSALPVET